MGRTPWKTAHKRIPTERVGFRASLSRFRPHPLVPGLFWFRARVILLTDGPTRPSQQPPVRGEVPTFPHPEPPLLFSFGRSRAWGLALGAPAPDQVGRRLCAGGRLSAAPGFMIYDLRFGSDAFGGMLLSVHPHSSAVEKNSSQRSSRANREIGVPDNVCATVQKAKHPACEKFFTPCYTRGYTIFGPRTRPEFRHDSCNTEHG
jgi:hypothetical protein